MSCEVFWIASSEAHEAPDIRLGEPMRLRSTASRIGERPARTAGPGLAPERATQVKSIKLLIFDWDGTLADSAGPIVESMQAAITALGLPPRPDARIRELIGLGWTDVLVQLFPEHDPREVVVQLEEYRRRLPPLHAHQAPLFSGAAEALHTLHGTDYRLAVATGKYRVGLDRALAAHAHTLPPFAITRCADETASKPNPLMLQEILDAMGLTPEQALMIGDTEYDMAMAGAIGMPALGVACGVHEADRLLRTGAVAVIDGVHAMPAWLREPIQGRG
jgi:phosphoglycolate phosphatase